MVICLVIVGRTLRLVGRGGEISVFLFLGGCKWAVIGVDGWKVICDL